MNSRLSACALGLAWLLLFAAAAPPPRLVSAAPAKDSHVEWPKQVRLQFSAPMDAASFAVVMIKPDGSHIPLEAPMPSADRKTLIAGVKEPTLPGPYMIMWHGQTARGAPLKGDYTFFVQ
jgi:methionine-rich copper-binding protein CopC